MYALYGSSKLPATIPEIVMSSSRDSQRNAYPFSRNSIFFSCSSDAAVRFVNGLLYITPVCILREDCADKLSIGSSVCARQELSYYCATKAMWQPHILTFLYNASKMELLIPIIDHLWSCCGKNKAFF